MRFLYDSALQSRTLPDQDMPIWRYIDLPKLIDILFKRSLWFATANTLGEPYEGSSLRSVEVAIQDFLGSAKNKDQLLNTRSLVNRAMVVNTAVTCWRGDPDESEAMWKLYCAAGNGLAIKSSVSRLLSAVPNGTLGSNLQRDPVTGAVPELNIEFGVVAYVDHHEDAPAQAHGRLNPVDNFFRKPASFRHEEEFRGVISDLPFIDGTMQFKSVFPNGGAAVPVDPSILIETVYLHPGAPSWFEDTVKESLRRFDSDCPVMRSRSDRRPLF